ncbi:unnamed protein product, partial [Tetraodon nigroviridis]
LQLFVEFENATQRCSWVQVYDEGVKSVMVEDSIVWVSRSDSTGTTGAPVLSTPCPALVFRSLVDRIGLGSLVPVEYFGNRNCEFLPDKKLLQRFEVDKDLRHPLLLEQPSLQAAISSWHSDFELQEIFRKGSYTIQGRRVRVYQPEFEECWALGLVSQHDPISHIMEITLDKGEENQTVDPRVIHVMLAEEEVKLKDSETMKGDSGRRRRTASEGEDDLNLKRFKGVGHSEADGQIGGDLSERVSSTTKNGSSSEATFPQGRVSSPGTNSLPQLDQSNLPPSRYPAHIKENGRSLPTQGAADSTTAGILTPNPPPLKPAPSPFATSFPSLGQMPSLVPGAPAPKSSLSPQSDREEPVQSVYSKTAALVSPGPVTISWSNDSGPSVALSSSVGFCPKTPTWGRQTEGSKVTSGFPVSQTGPTISAFGDAPTQTNGGPTSTSQDPQRPFGFGFGGAKPDAQCQQEQNLFFQCMSQNSGSNPIPAAGQTQSKDTNYFSVVSESLSKEPPSLFKPATTTDEQRKSEQPKVPETHPTRNGVLNKPSSVFQAVGGAAGGRSTLLSAGLQSSFNATESHKNIFLQASKEPANPFLAYGEKSSHTTFADLTGAESQGLGPASDNKPNLFTMAEPPKGILSSPFPALSEAASPSSSSSPASATSQKSQIEGTVAKEEQDVQEMPSSTSGSSMFGSTSGMEEGSASFDQNQSQKFALEERGQSSKRDSDSSSNSDLSDLSENEDGPEKDAISEGPEHSSKEGAIGQKSKVQGGVKGRPRNKPFKGKFGHYKASNCAMGQSVLKDQSKVRRLKQSGESFLQDGSCISVAPHLHKCRECRLERYRKYRSTEDDSDDEDDPNVACRFFHFRRLAFTRKGILRVEGFLSPQQSDSMAMGLWLPAPAVQGGLDLDTSKYILANVGDQFCQLVMSEKEAMMMVEPHQKVAWKRAVRGVREMCDVCETTLFNIHWVCRKCGFGVCLDCYRLRRNQPREDVDEVPEDEVFSWLKCAKGQPHEPQNLMPTQIIPGAALYNIGDMVHSARGKWGIKANCPCASRHTKPLARHSAPNGISQSTTCSGATAFASNPKSDGETAIIKTETSQSVAPSDSGGGEVIGSTSNATSGTSSPTNLTQFSGKEARSSGEGNSSALHWLADLATQKAKDDTKESGSLRSIMNRESRPPFGLDSLSALSKPSASSPKLFNSLLLGPSMAQSKPEGSSLRDLLNSGPGRLPQGPGESGVPFPSVFTTAGNDKLKSSLPNFLDHIIASVVETKKAEGRRTGASEGSELGALGGRKEGVMGLSVLEPHTSHSWLCDGRLLCLQDPSNSNNWKIFRECWKQGQPVLVSGIDKRLKSHLWQPEAFSKEFGDQDVDLVNCRNCAIISDVKVREFWDGFEVINKRLQDPEGKPMVLKLKDWPPGEDFRDMMPSR